MTVNEPIDKGTILSVRVANAAAIIFWVQIEVKNCRKADGDWLLGCQFVESPPSTVLWSFG